MQQRVRTDLGGALGEVDRVAGVVRSDAGDDRALAPHLLDGEADHPEVLFVVERRRLAGRAADHQPVRAVLDQVVHQRDGGILVDVPVGVERGDHRSQDRAEVDGHLLIIAGPPD